MSRDFAVPASSVSRHRPTSRVIGMSWGTSKTYYLLLELRFYVFTLASNIHFRFGRPPYSFPASVVNDRCTNVMEYAMVFEGESEIMKNLCIFAAVWVFPAVQC